MNRIVVITAVALDRPGIVAGLARALYEIGANLDDASMTRLHSVFTTMVSAALPEGVTVEDCRAVLAPVGKELGITVTVQEVEPDEPAAPPDHILTVYGSDKPGIVYRVAARLAERGVNITDMDTRRTGPDSSPLYIVLMEIASGSVDLADDLEQLKRDLQVDINLQSLDREAL